MSLEKNMPKELVITRPAYNDMQNIFEYISKDNKIAASKLLNLFEEKFDNIMNCNFSPQIIIDGSNDY